MAIHDPQLTLYTTSVPLLHLPLGSSFLSNCHILAAGTVLRCCEDDGARHRIPGSESVCGVAASSGSQGGPPGLVAVLVQRGGAKHDQTEVRFSTPALQ
jgi:hypothetical protein